MPAYVDNDLRIDLFGTLDHVHRLGTLIACEARHANLRRVLEQILHHLPRVPPKVDVLNAHALRFKHGAWIHDAQWRQVEWRVISRHRIYHQHVYRLVFYDSPGWFFKRYDGRC